MLSVRNTNDTFVKDQILSNHDLKSRLDFFIIVKKMRFNQSEVEYVKK